MKTKWFLNTYLMIFGNFAIIYGITELINSFNTTGLFIMLVVTLFMVAIDWFFYTDYLLKLAIKKRIAYIILVLLSILLLTYIIWG